MSDTADTAYTASALGDLKRQIAEKAIQRDLYEKCDWYGRPEDGFQAVPGSRC
jgi:hypothetical protein